MSNIYTPWLDDGDCPAPWDVEDTEERVVVRDAQGGFVASCTNGFDGDDGWVMSAACTPLANLIAAAPDLLAALKGMVEAFGDAAGNDCVAARIAIAKATS